MTIKHTIEPWRLGPETDKVEGYPMRSIWQGMGEVALVHTSANPEMGERYARLIAAAPDLLMVAKAALDFIHALPYEPSIAPSTKLQDQLVDAIAKATSTP